jgi:glycosyltransferase involved in cell wall biosynthesis
MPNTPKRLRIAQLAPITESVPPKKYGGTERIAHGLTEELVRRGHDVTLFASGDSITNARLVSVFPRALREARIKVLNGPSELSSLNFALAYASQSDFDIIHDHNGTLSLPTAHLATTPVVMTHHGPFTTTNRRLFEALSNPKIVCISHSQASTARSFKPAAVIHNGLPLRKLPFSALHDGYLVFVGRISAEKGVHIAIEVAQYLNLPLIIAAKLDAVDRPYFAEYIEPRLDNDQIRWIGEVDEHRKGELLSRARCFLNPLQWKEPFGLTMIEAMAAGCPVVAFNRGSVPEVVADGQTGYVVDDVDEMIEAVNHIDRLDRAQCRRFAIDHFDVSRMTDRYEELYYSLLGQPQPKKRRRATEPA